MARRDAWLAACTLVLLGLAAGGVDAKPFVHKGIKRVSIVFACHLDVGFNSDQPGIPGFDNAVLSHYFNEHLPRAAAIAEELRLRDGKERYVYMVHSWVVSLFLDCPARIGVKCPNSTAVATVKAAIRRGDITWHALPHNAQVEVYDADLLAFGVRLTHDLDRAFGLPPKATASQRDVPGLTRAAVPILADQGVKAITVGVNAASAPPAVPKNTPFWWRDEPSGKQLLAMWHPGGYSGWPVDSADECVQVAGLRHALCFAWRGDNGGPHTIEEIEDIYARVRAAFPKAKVAAAGLDDFVSELAAAAPDLDLPVLTQEIGDSWIYGIASDPAKMSEYLALLRMRRASRERYDDPRFYAFSRLLLKIPEHTWGTDTKYHPGDYERWSNADFQAALAEKGDEGEDNKFTTVVSTWVRQRAYLLWAVQELGDSPEGVAMWEALARLQDGKAPPAPGAANSSFKRASLAEPLLFEGDSWQLELSNLTGAIVGLRFKGCTSGKCQGSVSGSGSGSGSSSSSLPWWQWAAAMLHLPSGLFSGAGSREQQLDREVVGSWASFNAPLALPVYSTYSEDDYLDAIFNQYYYPGGSPSWWALRDFGKPNATAKGGARRADYLPMAEEVWWRKDDDGTLLVTVRATFDDFAVVNAGAPAALWTEIKLPPDNPNLELELTWENKTATRLPEAFWLRWVPRVDSVNTSSWRMYKLGQPISPLEVMRNGSYAQHAVGDEGVSVDSTDGTRRLFIRSFDANLVSPGRPNPLPSIRDPPEMRHGMAHCLVNNMWGTNYVMWYPYSQGDANMRFRFQLQVQDLPSSSSSSGNSGSTGYSAGGSISGSAATASA